MDSPAAMNTPTRRALSSNLLRMIHLLSEEDRERLRSELCHWPESSEGVRSVGAGVIPPDLAHRFSSKTAAHRALDQWLNTRSKSCVQQRQGSGGHGACYVCPCRLDSNSERVRCNFYVRLKKCKQKRKGLPTYWHFVPENAMLDHDPETCTTAHHSPMWMLKEHPFFLEDVYKQVKERKKAKELMADLAKQGGDGPAINVSKDQIKRARTSWESDLQEGFAASIKMVSDWLDRFEKMNETAHTKIEYDGEHFLRCLVIGPHMKTLVGKLSYRTFAIDGATLHDEWSKLKIIQITVRDGNRQVLPVAMALVPAESTDHVRWALQELKEYFSGTLDLDAPHIVWISDRGSGLLPAIEAELPNAFKFHCFRHLLKNVRKHCGGSWNVASRNACWKVQKSTSQRTFDRNMAHLANIN